MFSLFFLTKITFFLQSPANWTNENNLHLVRLKENIWKTEFSLCNSFLESSTGETDTHTPQLASDYQIRLSFLLQTFSDMTILLLLIKNYR